MDFKGFIFDMDGVIVDNHHFHFKAWMELSQKYHFPLDAEIYKKHYNGKTNKDLFKWIYNGNISDDEIQKLATEKEENYRRAFIKEMRPVDGLVLFLEELKHKNFKIALGTSAPTANVDFVLDGLNLRHFFDVIIDGTQVTQGKPHPEVYLKCIEGLRLGAHECVVFEDAILGIEAAKNAKSSVVGVATSHAREELMDFASIIIDDFTAIHSALENF